MRDRVRVVGIGGGSGLSRLLQGLRELEERERSVHLELTAIVSVADDGGSTGRLRRELGIPAVGDLRQCLAALAGGEPLWPEILQHRFRCGDGLDGHALGNLVLAALIERSGSLQAAIDQLARTLRMRGRVLAVTEQPVSLIALRACGEVVHGESSIARSGKRIERVWLNPESPTATAGVVEAIEQADAVVFGPGSLFTSIVPNLLVAGVADAVRRTTAVRIFVCNLRMQPGETEGFDAADHLEVLSRHLGPTGLDVCLADASLRDGRPDHGASFPKVRWDRRRISALGVRPVVADLRAPGSSDLHEPTRLAAAVHALVSDRQEWRLRRRRSAPAGLARIAAAALLAPGAP